MKYKKLLAVGLVILIATWASTQEMSPIVVETGDPVPSVVRTGELFTVTYRAKYTDAVLIVEEYMQLSSLALINSEEKIDQVIAGLRQENPAPGNAEVVKLDIGQKYRIGSDDKGYLNIQDFTYTFRIIGPGKGNKKIPTFDFIWVDKNAGTTEDGAKEKEELRKFPTDEVGISYVTSVVKPPVPDIKDEIDFPAYRWSGNYLRKTAYGATSLSFILVFATVYVFVKKIGVQKIVDEKIAENVEPADVAETGVILPAKQARKRILREFRKLLSGWAVIDDEKKVCSLLRDFMISELQKSPVRTSSAESPNALYVRLVNLDDGGKHKFGKTYPIVLALALKMRDYYEDMESEKADHFAIPSSEIQQLEELVRSLGYRKSFWKALVESFRMPNA